MSHEYIECPVWKYSSDCMKDCECNKKTSIGCDVMTGDCLCSEGYGGTDCSWQTSVIPQCRGPSKINYDRCMCKQGSIKKPTSCSGNQKIQQVGSEEKWLSKARSELNELYDPQNVFCKGTNLYARKGFKNQLSTVDLTQKV